MCNISCSQTCTLQKQFVNSKEHQRKCVTN